MLLPFFNNLSGRELTFSFTQFPQFAWLLAGVVLLTGLLAGDGFLLWFYRDLSQLKC